MTPSYGNIDSSVCRPACGQRSPHSRPIRQTPRQKPIPVRA